MGCCVAFLALCSYAQAQDRKKIPRIGVLVNGSTLSDSSRVQAFRDALHQIGYLEGQNLAIEYRFADGKIERFPALIRELLQANVDVIVLGGTPAALAAQQATRTIPVIFTTVADPIAVKLVNSLNRPGANITGTTTINSELTSKRLEVIKETVGQLSRVAFLHNPGDASNIVSYNDVKASAGNLRVTLEPVGVRKEADLDRVFASLQGRGVDALIVAAGALTDTYRKKIITLAAKTKLPAMYGERVFVQAGGLMSYAANFLELWRRGAYYVDKILKGAKPADFPVEQPTKFELAINLLAAKQIGLTIPQSVLYRADEVIR